MTTSVEVQEVADGITRFRETQFEDSCNCYLIHTGEEAILFDCGVGFIDFSSILSGYGIESLSVVVSHFHFDHIGGCDQFDTVYGWKERLEDKDVGMQYFDPAMFTSPPPPTSFSINLDRYVHVSDKVFNVGAYEFKVLYTPGHDRTSVCLYDGGTGVLLSGDLVYEGRLYLDLPDSDPRACLESLNQIASLDVSLLLPGHGPIVSEPDALIRKKQAEVRRIVEG